MQKNQKGQNVLFDCQGTDIQLRLSEDEVGEGEIGEDRERCQRADSSWSPSLGTLALTLLVSLYYK